MENNFEFKNVCYISSISSVAYTFANIVTYPLDLINTVIKTNLKDKKIKIIKKLYRKKGINGLFKGMFTVLPTNFPSSFSWFFVYEVLNNYTYNKIDKKYHNFVPFFNSSWAEIVCVFLLVPADTIQTRIQKGNYKNFRHGISKIRKGGLYNLYKSSNLMFLQQIILISTQYTFYENLRKIYINKFKKKNEILFIESINISIISTFLSNILVNPINYFVVQYQLNDDINNKISINKIYKKKYKKYGANFFNRGFFVRFLHLSLLSSIYIPTYEFIRQKYGMNPSSF